MTSRICSSRYSSQPLNLSPNFYDELQNRIGDGNPKMRWYFQEQGWPSSTTFHTPPKDAFVCIAMYKWDRLPRSIVEAFVLLLSLYAPPMVEELWFRFCYSNSLTYETLSKVRDWELTSETQPIWLFNPKEASTEEYSEFYKKLLMNTWSHWHLLIS